jgi:hypothetical protein
MADDDIINWEQEDQALLMSAASVDDVIEDATVSSYDSAVKSFSHWFFTILPPTQRESYGTNILTQTDPEHGYFTITDKDSFIKSLETTTNCCFYDYCLWKRRTHFIKKKTLGIGHFSHLSAAITNKLASQPDVKTISEIGNVVRAKFVKGLRKQAGKFKKVSGIEGNAKSVIPWDVYLVIATVFMETSVIYWLMFLLQFNLMCRSVDMTEIEIANFSWSYDMMTLEFTHKKTDGERAKLKTVHLASNPSNPIVCVITALAVYLATYTINGSKLFEGGSIRQGYADALDAVLKDPRVVEALKKAGVEPEGVATHSLRKAAATFAAGGTAGTPMHFTILIRGGWSIGKVLSSYFALADDGDRQLANLLAGRQYLTKDFSRLVPHFTTNVTKQVIRSVFVGEYINSNFDKLEGLLQFCIASIVYHYDSLKLLLPSNSACIDNYGRNQLRHLKQFLGPDYEDAKKTTMKPTGQGASILYQLIHENNALQKENNMLLKKLCAGDISISNIHGNANANELKSMLIDIRKNMRDDLNTVRDDLNTVLSHIKNNRIADFADTIIPDINITLNAYVHKVNGKKMKKVHSTYQLPSTFKDFVYQYVFSNMDQKRTAIRDCDAYHLYNEELYIMKPATKDEPSRRRTPDEMKKAYRAFQQTVKRSKTVTECFLQHAFHCHQQEYNSFLMASSLLERSSTFNDLFRVSWQSFQLKLKTTNRKRKLNTLTASSIYNNIHGKRSTNYLATLRSKCNLNTQRKKKMKWTFKLPSISLVSVNEETPSMVEDIESTSNNNTGCNNNSNNNNNNNNNNVNGNGMMMGSPQQVNVDESSNFGFDILYC